MTWVQVAHTPIVLIFAAVGLVSVLRPGLFKPVVKETVIEKIIPAPEVRPYVDVLNAHDVRAYSVNVYYTLRKEAKPEQEVSVFVSGLGTLRVSPEKLNTILKSTQKPLCLE